MSLITIIILACGFVLALVSLFLNDTKSKKNKLLIVIGSVTLLVGFIAEFIDRNKTLPNPLRFCPSKEDANLVLFPGSIKDTLKVDLCIVNRAVDFQSDGMALITFRNEIKITKIDAPPSLHEGIEFEVGQHFQAQLPTIKRDYVTEQTRAYIAYWINFEKHHRFLVIVDITEGKYLTALPTGDKVIYDLFTQKMDKDNLWDRPAINISPSEHISLE